MDNPYQSPQAEDPSPPPLRHRRGTVCPHCGEPALSLFQKSRVGPFKAVSCRACANPVGVTWRDTGRSILYATAPAIMLVAGVQITGFAPPMRSYFGGGSESYWVAMYWAIPVVGLLCGAVQVAVLTLLAPLVKK